jgi:hypothetical protein
VADNDIYLPMIRAERLFQIAGFYVTRKKYRDFYLTIHSLITWKRRRYKETQNIS